MGIDYGAYEMHCLDFHRKLILASLEGKYSSSTGNAQKRILVTTLYKMYSGSTEEELLAFTTPSIDLETDIANQVRSYVMIEKFWRYRKPTSDFLRKIHSLVMGLPPRQVDFRITETVPDYPNIPTQIKDIPSLVTEIDHQLDLLENMKYQTDGNKARYLAALFALIIRVHPFPDGNGRTARVLMQYCLRYWGYQYILLPKVRNDEIWKDALSFAINGNHRLLNTYFNSRLSKFDNT